jgi:hypothetical protein
MRVFKTLRDGRRPAILCVPLLLAGCGTPSFDMAGMPDKAQERLYAEGRLGGDKGIADFDLRRAWRAAFDSAQ